MSLPGPPGPVAMIIIGVVGGQHAPPEALRNAERVGYLIAKGGAALICGGLTGVMEASCKGAKSAGGLTIGLLPTGRKSDANPFVDIPIVTGLGTARNVVIVRTADAIVAIDGSYGTLSEIAHALERGKPIVSLGAWDLRKIGVDPELYLEAKDPEAAVRMAFDLAKKPYNDLLPF